jgi:hypothetical protein
MNPGTGVAQEQQSKSVTQVEALSVRESEDKSYVKVLSDHPGRATALTARQKAEIREIVGKAGENQRFICTAASLPGQRESMYRVSLIRAQLVCEYARTLVPSLKTTVQQKTTSVRKFNGRVVVVSK